MAEQGEIEQDIRSAPLLADADRFRLLGRLLEGDDLKFLEHHPGQALKLRKKRAGIFRGELGVIRSDVHAAFRSRLHRIGECGQWSRIFGLIADTGSAYAALSKLEMNAAFFRFSIPTLFDTSPNTDRLCRYFTFEMLTASDPA
jgi:hypothetical protein